MNQKLKHLFLITAMAGSALFMQAANDDCGDCETACKTGCTTSQNLWQPHAFSVSASREILLEKPAWTNPTDEEGWFGTFGVGFDFMRNFGEAKDCCEDDKGCCRSLGAMPFWSENLSNEMTVGNNNGGFDLDAYQMGLGAVTTNGTVRLTPKVIQTGGTFFAFAGASRTETGFFGKVHGSVGIMKIDPRLSFDGELAPADYPVGALNGGSGNTVATDFADLSAVKAPYENIQDAFAGNKTAGFLKEMKYGKIGCEQTTSAKFGDLAFAIGYNVYADETKHLGLAVRFSAPTGNKAEAVYALEPIWGRNGHWGAGGELMGHWRAWESDSDDCHLDFWLQATAEHLFRSNHFRSFDLKANGKGSKYLLVGKYSGGVTGAVFQNCIENAINVTTLPVESTFDIEANYALMADYSWDCWSFGLGYEGWYRGCEDLRIDCNCASTNLNDYAVLGRQTPFNEASLECNEGPAEVSGLDHFCEPLAQIGKSQDRLSAADLSCPAMGTTPVVTLPAGIEDATLGANRISEDLDKALDIDGQKAHAALTSKVFAQAAYTWKDSDYSPYIGISGAAEWSHRDNSATRMWSIGAQGGFAF